MNVVNRLIVVLGVMVLIAFAGMVIVLAWAYGPETIHKLGSFVTYLNDHDTTVPKIVITLGASFVILVALAFLLLEVAPRAGKTVAVMEVGMGTAVISTAAVSRRLEQIVTSLPQVEATRAKVGGKKKGISVNLQVMVDPSADLSATATEVAGAVEDAVTRQMKLTMAAPAHLQLYYSTRRMRPTASPPPYRAPEPVEERPLRKARVVPGTAEGEPEKLPVPTAEKELPEESSKSEDDR
jgi:hypothetical protein